MADLLIDTDIFIDHLRGHRSLALGRHRLHYSVITRAELFAGTAATAIVSDLLGPLRELPVDRSIAERAGRIRRESDVRLPDALIAATASSMVWDWCHATNRTSVVSAGCGCVRTSEQPYTRRG